MFNRRHIMRFVSGFVTNLGRHCRVVTTIKIPRKERGSHGKENQLSEIREVQESQTVNPAVHFCIYKYGVAKQEHAFAGAFAGIFVSLCLHPMDSVKTVIQSCHTHQRSIPYIGKSILSERGLSGLYRGITSNIASSASISAIYNFSYESVKGALLPLFAKEHHSLAHCLAGGFASFATSIVSTPSEQIKQQTQVGSHYHSSWNAFWGIIRKGDFSSLYNGCGAVLCRNVPHSIIKFYTYESLKSMQPNTHPTTISMLFCGGLAGSAAVLFTTPFDVVKTRLQTQIPGSGLYRGLTPRLAIQRDDITFWIRRDDIRSIREYYIESEDIEGTFTQLSRFLVAEKAIGIICKL
ncbi:hypothetical protein L1887_02128 [Cichorium endivia]|nr:hypothetical protein L1887_02128 [Cichorium endivia]